MTGDEVFIDGLPVGSFFSFLLNALISWFFQLPGFLLTYLLHSTHAAKNGSRLGLGVTLIMFGMDIRPTGEAGGSPSASQPDGYSSPQDPNSHDFDPDDVRGGGEGGDARDSITGSEWLMYILMVVGWYIFIRAIGDYLLAKRYERLVLQSPDRGLGVPIVAEGESPERVV